MNSRTNSGRGFLVPPGNDLPVQSPWMPQTPGKPILPRSNGLPVENHGDDQLGRANWPDGIGIPGRHVQKEMNHKGVAQNVNLIGRTGQNGSSCKLGRFPPEKGGFSHDVGSYSEAFGNGNAAWSNNPLAEALGIKNAETKAPENGVLNENVHEANAPAILSSYSQVDSSWTKATFTSLLLGGENPIPSSSQWIDADGLPQLPMDEFPVPLRPSYNLNSPPRSEADATSSTTNSFPFAPVTPDHAKQFERRRSEMLNFSVDESSSQEKDKPENLLISTGSGGIENHSDELLQNIVDSTSAAVSTVFKEKDILEQEGDQGLDLNKTPQQKQPKRRKHRPKVIVEGKPKRTPKPATPKNTNFKENPSGKRKYVRKKSLEATGNQQTDATNEVTVPTSKPRAKPCKRRLDFKAENDTKGESQGKNHQVEIHQENQAAFNLNLDSQTTKLGTGTRIIDGAKLVATTAHNAYVAEKPQARGTFNHSKNQLPAESIRLPQGYATGEPPAAINHNTLNTIARTVNMTTLSPYQNSSKNYSQGHQHLQGELNRNISQANTHKILEQTRQKTWQSILQRNLPNLSEKRGLKRDYDKATEQAGPSAENLRGSPFLCKEIYQVDDHNSNGSSYGTECSKKKGTEIGLHTVGCSTRSVVVNGDGSRQAIAEDRNRVYTNSHASLVNAMNFEGDKISKRAKNGVNNTRGGYLFYSKTVAHIMQQQLVASEHLANTDRMAEKRSSRSTQGHNITSPTAMTKFNLPSSTPSRTTTSVYEQEMEIFHAKMSVKGHKMAPTSSIQVSPGMNKLILQEHKDAWHDYQQYHVKDRGLPEKQKDTVTVDEITSRLQGLQITGRNREMNERDQQALVPYKGDRTVVPYDPIKKRKPRPKVDLDPETNRMWKLLMGKEGSEGIKVEDKDKEKWWEEERKVFRGRADSFIARMHLVQGDRRFSQWKGSVVDSVIGVFLTQNVSDHLSSSAFMSLAARFPYQSPNNDQTGYQSETSMMGKELVIHKLHPGGTIKYYETLTRQPSFYQASVKYHKSSEQRTEGPISGTRRTNLETEHNGKNESCSGSNSESEDSTQWCNSVNPRRPLPHMGRNAPFQEIHSPATWSSCFNDRSAHSHNQSEYISSNKEIHRLQNFNNLKNSSLLTQPIHSNIPHMQGPMVPPSHFQFHKAPSWTVQEPNCFETLRKESTSPLSSTASGITEGKGVDYMRGRTGHTAERISKTMVPQNGMPTVPAPTVGPYAFLNKHLTPGESSRQPVPHAGKGQLSHNNHQQEKSRTFQLESTWVKEPMQPTEAVATGQSTTGHQVPNGPQCTRQAIGVEESKQKFLESKAVESNVNNQVHFSGEVTSGMSANIFNARKGKAEEDKTKLFDWDSLRKKVQPNGRRKERSKDAMDSLDYETLRRVDVSVIADCIKERGMNNMLADRIKDFLDRMVREHGSIDLEWLRDVPPDQAKEYLLSIRGLGLKSVECVRLLTLHHLAFPVDTNVGRIAVRLGWVPLQPLPESLQLHLLELYPVLESIQKYLWPRLCKLDQRTLYELHYQLITFGKVFCTKSKPNCNACPLRAECRHFASAFASARLALPGPEEKSIVSSANPIATDKNPAMEIKPMLLPPAGSSEFKVMESVGGKCEPIIEEPTTPEPETIEVSESDIEDAFCDVKDVCYGDPDEIPTIKLNIEEFTQNLHDYVEKHMELQEGDMSKALVALNPKAAYIPTPKLKYVCRLRTEHQVYELPDSHSLLEGLDKREPDDPSPYLLAIWTPGETADSIQPPERRCGNQESGNLCNEKTCFSCNSVREANSQTVRGTLLIPCRTAMKGSFPLNGTYFQVNEVFADYESSLNPIIVPRAWIWNLPRRTVYFGTSVSTIFKGLPTEGIQYCFWRGFVCVRGFDRQTRAPKPLISRLHVSPTKLAKAKTEDR